MKDDEHIVFVFVGAGADRERLINLAKEKKLNNVEFYPPVKKSEMPDWYSSADICVVPLKKRNVFRYNIPSKMFEIMACEKPILLGAEGQAREILEEAGAGIAVEPENVEAYQSGLMELIEHPELREQCGKRGREYVLQGFTRKENAKRYLQVFEKVVRQV